MGNYRLALDVGSNSVGWCVMPLSDDGPMGISDAGARVFPDGRNPKDGSSNAMARRLARGMRRNRDRFVYRRDQLLNVLAGGGLLPGDAAGQRALTLLDPYELRARGIDHKLTPHELGRAFFHLNQRRGFKSNRKSDTKDNETGAIKTAIKSQRKLMEEKGARTFGELLYRRNQAGLSTRARLKIRPKTDDKGKEKKEDYYEFYPSRMLIEDEFNRLWDEQARHHPGILTDVLRERVHRAIFFQRDLNPPVVGKCTYNREEDRAPKALPIVQRRRIFEELNNLQVIDQRTFKGRSLTRIERDKLAKLFLQPNGKTSGNAEVTFDKMRKTLSLGDDTVFSHESDKRTKLLADTTAALLCHKDRLGDRWYQLTGEQQEQVVSVLLNENDEDLLLQTLRDNFGLDNARAARVADTPLPAEYSRLGITATHAITAELEKDVIPYSEAVYRAGYGSHSALGAGKRHDRLPYYGAVLERHVNPDPQYAGDPQAPLEKCFGKVGNPTVHIALNQVRKVVNEIIKLHGAPSEIHLEVLRDLKNSIKKRKEIEAEQAKNQKLNDDCARELREEFHEKVNRDNIERLRLWKELGAPNHLCIYTGEPIHTGILFTHEVEMDHILPFSKTLDDSRANKLLCRVRANRDKTNGTPFEAWGHSPQWQEILDRAANLPGNKRWRFGPDAMDSFRKDKDFIARHLTDSQYIARLAREYLAVLFEPGEGHNKVVCLPGRLTGLFRKFLGLSAVLDEVNTNSSRRESQAPIGEKNRNDHRHHALDAMVIGVMDRSFLQKAAKAHARAESDGLTKLMTDWEAPWPTFREDAREALGKIIVSHKPDHGIEGQLHNDIAYGVSKYEDPRGNAVHRIPAGEIEITNLLFIRGKRLRAEFLAHLSGLDYLDAWTRLETIDGEGGRGKRKLAGLVPTDEKEFHQKSLSFFSERGIRRVRIIEPVELVFPTKQGLYKGYKPDSNAYMEILRDTKTGNWKGQIVTTFEAVRQAIESKSGAREINPSLVKRVFKRDMLEMNYKGLRRVFLVQKVSGNTFILAEHFESDADARTRDKSDPFQFVSISTDKLRKAGVRFLVVTPAGRIRYLSDAPNDMSGDRNLGAGETPA